MGCYPFIGEHSTNNFSYACNFPHYYKSLLSNCVLSVSLVVSQTEHSERCPFIYRASFRLMIF